MWIEFGFCWSRNPFPWNLFALLINLFQKLGKKMPLGKCSHFYMAYKCPTTGEKMYLDSTAMGGVNDRSGAYFHKSYLVAKPWRVYIDTHPKFFMTWIQKYKGTGYGYLQILGLAAMILGFLGKNLFKSGNNRIICNELGMIFFRDFLGLFLSKSSDDYDLDETYEIINRYRGSWKVEEGTI